MNISSTSIFFGHAFQFRSMNILDRIDSFAKKVHYIVSKILEKLAYCLRFVVGDAEGLRYYLFEGFLDCVLFRVLAREDGSFTSKRAFLFGLCSSLISGFARDFFSNRS